MTSQRPRAIVTGAARRVGRAIARELAGDGFDLILTYHTSDDEIRETVRECARASKAAADVVIEQLDLSDADDVAAAIKRWRLLPALDAIVHNASSYSKSPLEALSLAGLESHFRINAGSPALITTGLAPLLGESALEGGGAVVCFGDIHVMGRPRRDYLAYAMSKAALLQIVESLAVDLAPKVRVNGVAPGVVAWPDDADPAEIIAYERRIPLERPGTPEEAARLVRWLIREATYITGEIIRLDGGRWLR